MTPVDGTTVQRSTDARPQPRAGCVMVVRVVVVMLLPLPLLLATD